MKKQNFQEILEKIVTPFQKKTVLKHDLQKLNRNYRESGEKNLETANSVFLELSRQLFASTSFYLIFLATIFFFLKDRFSVKILFIPVEFWLGGAIVIGTLAMIIGVLALIASRTHLMHAANYDFGKATETIKYIKENNITIVSEIPDHLKGWRQQITSSKLSDILFILQTSFFALTVTFTMIAVIGAILL